MASLTGLVNQVVPHNAGFKPVANNVTSLSGLHPGLVSVNAGFKPDANNVVSLTGLIYRFVLHIAGLKPDADNVTSLMGLIYRVLPHIAGLIPDANNVTSLPGLVDDPQTYPVRDYTLLATGLNPAVDVTTRSESRRDDTFTTANTSHHTEHHVFPTTI